MIRIPTMAFLSKITTFFGSLTKSFDLNIFCSYSLIKCKIFPNCVIQKQLSGCCLGAKRNVGVACLQGVLPSLRGMRQGWGLVPQSLTQFPAGHVLFTDVE